MRGRGRGQRFDKWWQKNNELYNTYWYVGRDIENDIDEVVKEVEKIEPYSDYEVKDKANLLEQLSMLRLRNKQLQEELKAEE